MDKIEKLENLMDKECYDRFLMGDLSGFEELVLKYKDSLIFFLYRYIKDMNYAEDLAQDAFVEIYIHKERYNGVNTFKTYLYTIGRNKAIDFIRKQKHHANHVSLEDQEHNMIEERELIDKVIGKENSAMVRQGLTKIKKEYSDVIFLLQYEQLSYKEAAVVLDKTLPQIKVLFHRAKKALKKVLEREGFLYEE